MDQHNTDVMPKGTKRKADDAVHSIPSPIAPPGRIKVSKMYVGSKDGN